MNSTRTKLLSVIIPTRNRASFAADLLDTLAAQIPVPFSWEVLVIDNGSTDQTERIVQEKISTLPIEIRYIYEPRPGLHNGRHRGALDGCGKYLAYLDDDVILTPTWIHGVEQLMGRQAEAVVGRILPKWETRPPGWLAALAQGEESSYFSLLDRGTHGFYIDPSFVYGDNFLIPRQLVFDLGGFHPDSMPADQLRYRGDGESALMLRFKEAGCRAWYDPAATVYHRVPRSRMSLDYLRKRAFAQGISDSFTEIRSKKYETSAVEDIINTYSELPHPTLSSYINRLKGKSFAQLCSSFATRILRFVPFSQPYIRKQLKIALLAGFNYHQNEVRNDPKLLKWVLQENYWDCRPDA
jgi:glucosyl-dolichyl phosphate glucuronosyltransferase